MLMHDFDTGSAYVRGFLGQLVIHSLGFTID